jgi:hypothetical protein
VSLCWDLFFFSAQFSKELNNILLIDWRKTLETTRGWIVYASGDEGSAYDIGEFEPSLIGIITKFPAGLQLLYNRTFFMGGKKTDSIIIIHRRNCFSLYLLYSYFIEMIDQNFSEKYFPVPTLFSFSLSL